MSEPLSDAFKAEIAREVDALLDRAYREPLTRADQQQMFRAGPQAIASRLGRLQATVGRIPNITLIQITFDPETPRLGVSLSRPTERGPDRADDRVVEFVLAHVFSGAPPEAFRQQPAVMPGGRVRRYDWIGCPTERVKRPADPSR